MEVEGGERQRARIRTSLFPALCLRTDLEVLKRQRKRRSVEEETRGGSLKKKSKCGSQCALAGEDQIKLVNLTCTFSLTHLKRRGG